MNDVSTTLLQTLFALAGLVSQLARALLPDAHLRQRLREPMT
jgi:hypothetical protein